MRAMLVASALVAGAAQADSPQGWRRSPGN
jgi:hypothetical protein